MSTILNALDKARQEKEQARLKQNSQEEPPGAIAPFELPTAQTPFYKRLVVLSLSFIIISLVVLGLAIYFFYQAQKPALSSGEVTIKTVSIPQQTKVVTPPEDRAAPSPIAEQVAQVSALPELRPEKVMIEKVQPEEVAKPAVASTEAITALPEVTPLPVIGEPSEESQAIVTPPIAEPSDSQKAADTGKEPETVKLQQKVKESPGDQPEIIEAEALGLKIEGIIPDPEKPLAVINDKLVGPGEVIEEKLKIVKITADSLIIEKEGKTYKIIY